MLRRCLLALFGAMFLACFAGYAGAETNIGLVDTKAVFENHPKALQAKEDMEQEMTKFQNIFQAKQEEIKKLKEKLDSSSLLSDEEKEKQKKVINDKITELMSYKDEKSQELQVKEEGLTREIVDDIYSVISTIAKSKNLQLVLEKGSTLYAVSGLDLTEEVMKSIGEKNQKAGVEDQEKK